MSPRFEPIPTWRYLNLTCARRHNRLYIEEAGKGIPLFVPANRRAPTAGSISVAQRHGITDNYRVIVFDMPWHGKSSPPEGFPERGVHADSAG